MTLLILTLVLVAAAACLFVPRLRAPRRMDPAVRRRWTAVTATTADGVRAHLQVEYAMRVTDPVVAPAEVDDLVADEVEDRVREKISKARARNLPDGGVPLTWAPESLVPGVAVEHLVVTSADLAVTPELRRLLEPAPGTAWT